MVSFCKRNTGRRDRISIPAGFVQLDLFSAPTPKSESKKLLVRKPKGTVYRCDKCNKAVVMSIPAVVIVCRFAE
jgi:hypothetical protein